MITQDYELKIIVKTDVAEGDPADWLFKAVNEGLFKEKCLTTFLTEVTPIDSSTPEYKWIADMEEQRYGAKE